MAARMSDRRPDDDRLWHGQATRSPRGFSKGQTVPFWHDITSFDLGGGATPKAGSVLFDWAERGFRETEIKIYYRVVFAVFVLLWNSTDCVEQTDRASMFCFKYFSSEPKPWIQNWSHSHSKRCISEYFYMHNGARIWNQSVFLRDFCEMWDLQLICFLLSTFMFNHFENLSLKERHD